MALVRKLGAIGFSYLLPPCPQLLYPAGKNCSPGFETWSIDFFSQTDLEIEMFPSVHEYPTQRRTCPIREKGGFFFDLLRINHQEQRWVGQLLTTTFSTFLCAHFFTVVVYHGDKKETEFEYEHVRNPDKCPTSQPFCRSKPIR
jgi:hypothetical protein